MTGNSHDARGPSHRVSVNPTSSVSPSEDTTQDHPTTPHHTHVPPQVSHTKPPSFTHETHPHPTPHTLPFPTRAYPEDVARFRAMVKKLAGSGLVASTGVDMETGRKVGGRPPVAAETLKALLDNAEAISRRPRASRVRRGSRGIQRIDEAARIGFGRLFRAFPTRLLPYRPHVERVVSMATGADRAQRRIDETIGFCERRLIAGFAVAGGGRPARLDLVLPTVVPDLYYGWGPVVYNTTLDGEGFGA